MRSVLSSVMIASLLLLTAPSTSVLATQNCAYYNCAPICTVENCWGVYSHYTISNCTGGTAFVRCYWDCEHFSELFECLCPDCECIVGGGQGCFLAGTPILLADGSAKPIELIQPGDRVASFDPALHQRTPDVVAAVTHTPRGRPLPDREWRDSDDGDPTGSPERPVGLRI